MSTVQEIKAAIDHLPIEQRAELVAELCGWTDDDWDRQMKADAKAGKFDAQIRESDASFREGKTRSLSDVLDELWNSANR
jgi:hypothetical protein